MSNLEDWSITASENTATAPDGFPEGMLPNALNNAGREVMAAFRRFYDDPEYLQLSKAYVVSRTGANSIRIAGVDQTSIFKGGMRIKVMGGGDAEGFLTSDSTFSAGNTNMVVDFAVPVGTSSILVHFARTAGPSAFRNVGSDGPDIPDNATVISTFSPANSFAKKLDADQEITTASFVRLKWNTGTGAGADYITVPGADGARDYLLTLMVLYGSTSSTGVPIARIYVGANGSSADTLLFEGLGQVVTSPGQRHILVPQMLVQNPATGSRVSVYVYTGDSGGSATLTAQGAGTSPAERFSYLNIEEAL